MTNSRISYNHTVKVFSEAGELLGTGRFVGTARTNSGGRGQWDGRLNDISFSPQVLHDAGRLRLEFDDGAVGDAFCTKITRGSRSGTRIELKGTGAAPMVEAG